MEAVINFTLRFTFQESYDGKIRIEIGSDRFRFGSEMPFVKREKGAASGCEKVFKWSEGVSEKKDEQEVP